MEIPVVFPCHKCYNTRVSILVGVSTVMVAESEQSIVWELIPDVVALCESTDSTSKRFNHFAVLQSDRSDET